MLSFKTKPQIVIDFYVKFKKVNTSIVRDFYNTQYVTYDFDLSHYFHTV